MSVFREISLEFGGKAYVFTPSNKLLRRIDAGLNPSTLMGVVHVMNGEQLPLYDVAYIISQFIAAGGGDVSEDDVLAELYDDMQHNKGEGVRDLIVAIGEAISPPGNSQAPVAAESRGKAKRK